MLIEDPRTKLQDDELHLVKILMEDMKLEFRVGNTTGKQFPMNNGVPQGDCISPILFTLYLAKALSAETGCTETTES